MKFGEINRNDAFSRWNREITHDRLINRFKCQPKRPFFFFASSTKVSFRVRCRHLFRLVASWYMMSLCSIVFSCTNIERRSKAVWNRKKRQQNGIKSRYYFPLGNFLLQLETVTKGKLISFEIVGKMKRTEKVVVENLKNVRIDCYVNAFECAIFNTSQSP